MRGPMQRLFEALPPPGAGKTVAQLAAETGLRRNKVSEFCCRLRRRGMAERRETGVYHLTAAGLQARSAGQRIKPGPNGPLTGRRRPKRRTVRDKAWAALRSLRKATVPDLLTIIDGAGESNVGVYLSRLQAAGFVQPLKARVPGTHPASNGFKQWLLIRNTGPKAPVFSRKENAVWDPNTGEVHKLGGPP